ncbi:phage repressor protein CI [Pantoea sp. JGM49]|uniref:phage repressor protein CI n=1 Tax=Pantoea sp. JGM49 TaxID=2799791 RepID=UPI001BA8A892|nr:phage repressor protein CI [Pantoea sp. JGM49]MBS0880157.1 phage repressor protein CI [Pantoea sp. JGM49]
MNDENLNTQELIERISSSYGVTTQRALAEVLGVPSNSVSTWVQRNSFPGKAIIQCSLETGADLNWLMTGKPANSNLRDTPSLKGKRLYDEIMTSGGKPVLRRILDAYGFSMQKELGDLLDISSGTISTWIRRDYFPGDVVVACALDTGVSLRWLSTGKGEMFESVASDKHEEAMSISKHRLESGKLIQSGNWTLDSSLSTTAPDSLIFIEGISHSWIANTGANNISNGRWVIDIDESLDVFDVVRLPGGKLRLSNSAASFECAIADVKPFAAVIFTLEKNL